MTENKIIILKRLIDEHFEKIHDLINPVNKISKIIKKLKNNFLLNINTLFINPLLDPNINLIKTCFFDLDDLITQEYQIQSTKINNIKIEMKALEDLNSKNFVLNKSTKITEKTNSITKLLFNNNYTKINIIVNDLLSYYKSINNDINDISKIYEIKKLLITDNPYLNYYIIEIKRIIKNLNLTNDNDKNINQIFLLFEKYKQDDYKVDETNITDLINKLNEIIQVLQLQCPNLTDLKNLNCVLVNYLKEIINLQKIL